MENLVRLPFPEEDNSTEVLPELAKYPAALRPFINATALNNKRRANSTEVTNPNNVQYFVLTYNHWRRNGNNFVKLE